MLAQLENPTPDFYALARYLVEGRQRPPNPKRVAWVLTHNLPTNDPERVAKLMTATAARSARCAHACYHAMIAWHEDERPSPEMMQEIALKTLELAGLAEHQAFIMGHGDKAHPHLHMMINRVHPDTGRAWATSHDYRRFDRIMKQLSEEYGCLYVPSHAFEPEMTDGQHKLPNSAARYAAKRGANTTRVQWSRATTRNLSRYIADHIELEPHGDLDAVLADVGLTLEPKGKGFVIGNEEGYAKLSALRLPTETTTRLRARRPTPTPSISRPTPKSRRTRRPPLLHPPKSSSSPWMVDAVDIARAMGTRDDLRAAVSHAQGVRKARLLHKSLMAQLMDEMKETLKASTTLNPAKSKDRRRRRRPPSKSRDPDKDR